MRIDYRKANFELKPFERFTKSELTAAREWSRKHPCDFAMVRRSKKMVATIKAQAT